MVVVESSAVFARVDWSLSRKAFARSNPVVVVVAVVVGADGCVGDEEDEVAGRDEPKRYVACWCIVGVSLSVHNSPAGRPSGERAS